MVGLKGRKETDDSHPSQQTDKQLETSEKIMADLKIEDYSE